MYIYYTYFHFIQIFQNYKPVQAKRLVLTTQTASLKIPLLFKTNENVNVNTK